MAPKRGDKPINIIEQRGIIEAAFDAVDMIDSMIKFNISVTDRR